MTENGKYSASTWLRRSWDLHPHALHIACVCFRCVWRRVHRRFWESLPDIMGCNSANMSAARAFQDEDSQIDVTDDYEDIVPSTQHSQLPQQPRGLIPDSYVDSSRVPLPHAPLASIPPGNRLVHDRLKPIYAATFPNVHRYFNDKSRPLASISWEFCNAEELWSIVTCKFLASGRQETMAWFQHQALKYVHELLTRFVAAANDATVSCKVFALLVIVFLLLSHTTSSGTRSCNNLLPHGLGTCSLKPSVNRDFSKI